MEQGPAGRIHPVLDKIEPALSCEKIANLHQPQEGVRVLALEKMRVDDAGRDDRHREGGPEDDDDEPERRLTDDFFRRNLIGQRDRGVCHEKDANRADFSVKRTINHQIKTAGFRNGSNLTSR
jgi:hypothetical protein